MAASRGGRLAALVVGAILVVVWWRVLIGGHAIAAAFYQEHAVPEQGFAAAARAAGRLPLWWDEVALGVPFAAVLDRAAFYPPASLAAPLPWPWALDALVVAHLLGFGCGAAALARRLGGDPVGGALAGAIAATGGVACSAAALGPAVFALAWAPWALAAVAALAAAAGQGWRACARPAAGAAAAGAMILLGGDRDLAAATAVAALALVALGAGGARWRASLALAAAALAAVAAAAVAVVPAALAGLLAPRGGFAALHPLRALELVWGGATLYLALPVLLAAGCGAARGGRWRLALAGVVALALACAARWLPAGAGAAGALVVPAFLVLGALAGMGGAPTTARTRPSGAAAGRGPIVAAAIAVAALAAAIAIAALHAAAVELAPRAEVEGRPPLAASDMTSGARLLRPLVMSGAPTGDRAALADWSRRTLGGARAVLLGYRPLRPGDPGESAAWLALWRAAGAAGERLLDLVGVERAILPATVATALAAPIVGRDGDWVLAALPRRRPRAFIASRARHFPDEAAMSASLFPTAAERRPRLAPTEIRLLGLPPPSPSPSPSPDHSCSLSSPRPERVILDCTTASAAASHAVLLDAFASGWSATVDGSPTPILRADLVVRAVPLPPGPARHRVVFDYRLPGLVPGAALSLLAWLALGLVAYLGRPRTSGNR